MCTSWKMYTHLKAAVAVCLKIQKACTSYAVRHLWGRWKYCSEFCSMHQLNKGGRKLDNVKNYILGISVS